MRENSFGQTIGDPLLNFTVPKRPSKETMNGRYCRLEYINPDQHAADLFEAKQANIDHPNWTYMPYGPFSSLDDYRTWIETTCMGEDPVFYAVIDSQTDKAVGVASYLRIDPNNGAIEVGHIHFSPLLQKSRASSEAMYLMMEHVFSLGYRRYEWKCDSLNEPSRRAAQRLGFSFEGIFRQATHYKGRNRDTAWFAMIDSEWPALKSAYRRWLDPDNFDAKGNQMSSLGTLTADAIAQEF
ncbi:MAG: GNAT family protein [Pseudomonadota bacterium]